MVRNSLLQMNVSWQAGARHNVSIIHCPVKLRVTIGRHRQLVISGVWKPSLFEGCFIGDSQRVTRWKLIFCARLANAWCDWIHTRSKGVFKNLENSEKLKILVLVEETFEVDQYFSIKIYTWKTVVIDRRNRFTMYSDTSDANDPIGLNGVFIGSGWVYLSDCTA